MAARLSFDERARIEAMAAAGVTVGEIAGRLGRHATTVYRELKRAGCVKGRWGCYDAEAAQQAAGQRSWRPKQAKLAALPELAGEVRELLEMRWSPHAVAAELRRDGAPAGLRVCAETIYKACYDHTGGSGLPEGCCRKLPRRCHRRKPRGRAAKARPGALGEVRCISQRPVVVAERGEAGHWEGDLIIGARNRSSVVTLIERASRFTLLAGLPGGCNADATAAAVTAAMRRVPSHMAKTLTWDRGSEMARWRRIEADTGIEVFFCDPRSPWQRPSNEQNNALICRWLPKSTNLDVGAVRLAIIEDNLNTMPQQTPQVGNRPHRVHCPHLQPPLEFADHIGTNAFIRP